MQRTRRIAALVIAASLAVLVGLAGPPAASGAGSKVLDLELNEARGARVAHDTSGRNHNGAIGSHLVMNGSYGHWDRHSPSAGAYYGARHLIVVKDAADHSLDPGRSNFSVVIRFRTHDSFGNIVQKGQARSTGGQVKFQIPGGRVTSMFKTASGTATAGSRDLLLNDDHWHTVRCDRTTSSVTMYVDGVRVSRTRHSTGRLDNGLPWTIGGKLNCGPDSGADSCDYFSGDIDFVRLFKG
jgi:hypothetical protein